MRSYQSQLFSFLVLFLFSISLNAQEILHPTSGTTTYYAGTDFFEGDIYYDSGGSTGNYGANESSTLHLCPIAGNTITVVFNTARLYCNGSPASLEIQGTQSSAFDGVYTAGNDCGTVFPLGESLISNVGQCLTFIFNAGRFDANGWQARILNAPLFPIPTLSQWGIIVLGLSLFVFSILAIRKRKPYIIKE
jgi:hypothetical protein